MAPPPPVFTHMTSNESILENADRPSTSWPVTLPNGDSLPISSIGQTSLSPNIALDDFFFKFFYA